MTQCNLMNKHLLICSHQTQVGTAEMKYNTVEYDLSPPFQSETWPETEALGLSTPPDRWNGAACGSAKALSAALLPRRCACQERIRLAFMKKKRERETKGEKALLLECTFHRRVVEPFQVENA